MKTCVLRKHDCKEEWRDLAGYFLEVHALCSCVPKKALCSPCNFLQAASEVLSRHARYALPGFSPPVFLQVNIHTPAEGVEILAQIMIVITK